MEIVNLNDVIEVMIEEKETDEVIIDMLKEVKSEWGIELILCLVIMKNRYYLAHRIFEEFE